MDLQNGKSVAALARFEAERARELMWKVARDEIKWLFQIFRIDPLTRQHRNLHRNSYLSGVAFLRLPPEKHGRS